MNQDKFDAFVRKKRKECQDDPRFFKLESSVIIFTGFAYLFFILLIEILAAAVFIFLIPFTLFVTAIFLVLTCIVIYHTIKSIYKVFAFRIDPPEGLYLEFDEVPALKTLTEDICAELNNTKIDKLIIVDDTNAAIIQIPKFGVLGGYQNYLLIGMPLLLLLSPEQLKAVIAHEVSHVSNSHGKFSMWVSRMESIWVPLVKELHESTVLGDMFFLRFYNWYIINVVAIKFAANQIYEKDVDLEAAKIAGAQCLADALALINLFNIYTEFGFWQDYYAQALSVKQPPPIVEHIVKFINKITNEDCAFYFDALLHVERSLYDSHPSLKDRYDYLQAERRPPVIAKGRAAEAFIDETIRSKFETLWKEDHKLMWGYTHTRYGKLAARYDDLLEKSELTQDEQAEKLSIISKIKGYDLAMQEATIVMETDKYNPTANLILGKHLILQGREDAISMLMRAVNRDLKLFADARKDINFFYVHYKSAEELKEFFHERTAVVNKLNTYLEYVNGIPNNFIAYESGISDDCVSDGYRRILFQYDFVFSAYLLKKKEKPSFGAVHVLILKLSSNSNKKHKKELRDLYGGLQGFAEEYGIKVIFSDARSYEMRKVIKKMVKYGYTMELKQRVEA